MILTVAALILPLALLFFADLDTYIVTCAFLYGILLCYRYARNERSVLDMVFFFTYLILSVLQTAIGIQRFVPFTGSVIYALLTAVFFLASTGMPLTTAASKTWQPEILLERSVGNGILAVMNGLALIFSLTLFPSVSYIIVPLVFTFASIPASIFLPPILIDGVMRLRARFIMSKEDAAVFKRVFGNIRGLVWVSDTLYAKEVWSESEREMFFSVLEKGYFSIYQKSKNPSKGTYAEFMNAIREEYAAFARRSSSFIVYDTRTQAPVGCIRIVLGGPAHGGGASARGLCARVPRRSRRGGFLRRRGRPHRHPAFRSAQGEGAGTARQPHDSEGVAFPRARHHHRRDGGKCRDLRKDGSEAHCGSFLRHRIFPEFLAVRDRYRRPVGHGRLRHMGALEERSPGAKNDRQLSFIRAG